MKLITAAAWALDTFEEGAVRELSLFTGAGGGLLGTKILGWTHVGYVEWNEYCQRVIAQRIADGYLDPAPIFTDVRQFVESGAAEQYRGVADVVTAGFPCQPYSYAGNREGSDDERDMWPATVACIRIVRPRLVRLENVTGLLAGYLGRVLGDLAALRYDAEWDCLPASDSGLPHFRDRTWVTAHAHGAAGTQPHQRAQQPRQQTPRRRDVDGLALAQRRASEAKAVFRGMDDGLAHRMDRLAALGNGQVPAVAARAWGGLT